MGATLVVAQNGIGLVDHTKLLFGFVFVFGHVRVVLARQFLKGTFDVFFIGIPWDSEYFVIIAAHN